MHLSVLLIVVAAVGNVRGLQSTTTGYGVESATFLSTDRQCSGLPISIQNAAPLGYCIPTSNGGKILSANYNGQLYSTTYYSSVCSGTVTGSDVALSSTCICSSSSCIKTNYYSTIVPAINGGTFQMISTYVGSYTCAGTATRIDLGGVADPYSNSCSPTSPACSTSTYNGVTSAQQTTCSVGPGTVTGYYQNYYFPVR